jgi:2-hydroxy-3-keto-5-methylthiopentenyl-1-phosphate phosphatase
LVITEPYSGAPVVFLDFDGTISRRDAIDAILETFASEKWLEIEERWRSGQIGSRECLRKQMGLVRATADELNELLDSVDVDDGFATLLETCASYGVAAYILSDGFDYCIRRILSRPSLGLARLLRDVRIFSSHLERSHGNWVVGFPYFEQICAHGCATCKPALMDMLNSSGALRFFVGDGLSDKYAALNADFVLAKNSLAVYCQDQGLAHLNYDSLAQVSEHLDAALRSNVSVPDDLIAPVGLY